jgi:hypothetical protein
VPRHDLSALWWIALLALASGAVARTASAQSSPIVIPPGGPRPMTLTELRELAVQVGMAQPDVAAAIAMAESGGNPLAVGDSGTSFGLWQIHLPSHPEYDALTMGDPLANALAAKAISSGGSKWTPWTTFNNGAYKKFMPPGVTA